MDDKERIKLASKINPKVINDDNTIKSFKEQLLEFQSGEFDLSKMFVVSTGMKDLDYVDKVNENIPVVMRVNNVLKCMNKHNLSFSFIGDIENKIKNSVLAFQSYSKPSSLIFVLNECDELDNTPIIAVLRTDKRVGNIEFFVEEITSVYDKKNMNHMIQQCYDDDLKIYCNKKTKTFIESHTDFYLSKDIINAFDTIDYSGSFNKSQIEELNISAFKERTKMFVSGFKILNSYKLNDDEDLYTVSFTQQNEYYEVEVPYDMKTNTFFDLLHMFEKEGWQDDIAGLKIIKGPEKGDCI